MKHQNPVPTDRPIPLQSFPRRGPEERRQICLAALAPALDFPEFGDVTMRDLARAADGGGIFRLVVSRFNRLQSRCNRYPQQDPHTC